MQQPPEDDDDDDDDDDDVDVDVDVEVEYDKILSCFDVLLFFFLFFFCSFTKPLPPNKGRPGLAFPASPRANRGGIVVDEEDEEDEVAARASLCC